MPFHNLARTLPRTLSRIPLQNLRCLGIRRNHASNVSQGPEIPSPDTMTAIDLFKLTRGELHMYVRIIFGTVILGLADGAYKLIIHDNKRDEGLTIKIDGMAKEMTKEMTEIKEGIASVKASTETLIKLMRK